MRDVKVTIECAECRKPLIAGYEEANQIITVRPCENCSPAVVITSPGGSVAIIRGEQ